MILALALCLSAAAVLAWLIFALAVYALPVAAGGVAATLAYGSGAGLPGAAIVGLVSGAIVFAAGQVAIERSRSTASRSMIIAFYTLPAAVAGFAIVQSIAAKLVPNSAWQIAFASLGGLAVAATAWARLTAFAPPGGSGEVRGPSVAQP